MSNAGLETTTSRVIVFEIFINSFIHVVLKDNANQKTSSSGAEKGGFVGFISQSAISCLVN